MTPLRPLQELLYSALAEPIGLLVRCDDWITLRTQLYNAKASTKDPELSGLQLRQSPFEDCPGLVIVNSTIRLPRFAGRPQQEPPL